MQYLTKTKVGKAHQKADTIYPSARLTRQFINIIDETANHYKIQHEGQDALMIVLGKNKSTSMVTQPNCTTDVRKNLSPLNRKSRAKSLILQHTSESDVDKEKRADSKIRTCVVASTGTPYLNNRSWE